MVSGFLSSLVYHEWDRSPVGWQGCPRHTVRRPGGDLMYSDAMQNNTFLRGRNRALTMTQATLTHGIVAPCVNVAIC